MSIVCWVDGHYTEILLVQRCSRLGQGWFHPPSVPWPHQSLVGPSMLPRFWETGFIMAEKMRQVYCYTWYTKHPWMLLIHQSMWMSNGWSLQQWGSAFFGYTHWEYLIQSHCVCLQPISTIPSSETSFGSGCGLGEPFFVFHPGSLMIVVNCKRIVNPIYKSTMNPSWPVNGRNPNHQLVAGWPQYYPQYSPVLCGVS